MILRTDGQRLKGRKGTWYMIEMAYVDGHRYYMYESEQWGEDVPHIAVSSDGRIICETYDDLETTIAEELYYRREQTERGE